MILEDEPVSLKDKVIRVFVAIFLFILVGMLIITLLPGDLETGFMSILSGNNSSDAGKVGKITIPMDYFHAARKDCYYRYKQYAPSLAENNENINSCSYQLIQNLKIAGMIAEGTGYTVSEYSIKKDLSKQAREIYRNSVSAGYAKNELSQPDEIFTKLIRSAPMPYRIDTYIAGGLFDRFLTAVIRKTENEALLEGELAGASVGLKVVAFKDTAILDKLDREIVIPEAMIKQEYEASLKDTAGTPEPFEKKRTFIVNKLKAKEKQKRLKELKDKLKLLSEKSGNLAEIAGMTGGTLVQMTQPLNQAGNLNVNGQKLDLGSNSSFWKDLTGTKFGTTRIGGPYTSAEYTTFIEFTGFNPGKGTQIKRDDEDRLVFEFFNEINQSLTESFPIQRNITGQGNAN